MMDEVCIYNDPLGVVLVMGAWNYPLQLPLVPFAAAIAAGNCVILKPSEVSVNCAKFITEMIPKYMDNVSRFKPIIWEIFETFLNIFSQSWLKSLEKLNKNLKIY